jgi:hypothetical protein
MVRIKWTEFLQLSNHFRSNSLRFVILWPAMHHAMPDRGQCVGPAALLDPIHQKAHGYRVIWRLDWARKVVCLARCLYAEGGFRQSNPLNSAIQNPSKRIAGFEHGKFNTRRATIDRQNAWVRWFASVGIVYPVRFI